MSPQEKPQEKSQKEQEELDKEKEFRNKYMDLYHKLRSDQENSKPTNLSYIDGEDGVDENPKKTVKDFNEYGGTENDLNDDS